MGGEAESALKRTSTISNASFIPANNSLSTGPNYSILENKKIEQEINKHK